MSKNQITIAKPDASRSCHFCKHSDLPPGPTHMLICAKEEEAPMDLVEADEAEHCPHFRDTRRTSQIVSAGGKVFD